MMPTTHAQALEFKRTTLQTQEGHDDGSSSAFLRLPDEIIEEILLLAEPNAFSSLTLLNNQWRRVSQQAHLYAHQLSKLPSSSKPIDFNPPVEDKLSHFRNRFAEEARRNLFDFYIRPRETVVKLISTSASSSSAFPGGEAFHFSFSSSGHFLLAYTSSRLYMLDVAAENVKIAREFKILRRPVTATVLNDGSLLAVLSSDHQVDIYDLTGQTTKHVKALALDHPPRTIALSPEGTVLAVAYDGGIEVYSLTSQTQTVERRAVKCDAADSLTFSHDGTQLLGTTLHSRNPNTVVLCAPYYDDDVASTDEGPQQSWTTSILFPNTSRDCSHAILLPNPSDYEASWTFTYDRVFETFRAVRVDDLRNGTTYFHGPAPSKSFSRRLLPHTLPASNEKGEMVAAGFEGREIWLYGVPGDLDALPEVETSHSHEESELSTPPNGSSRRNSLPFQARNFSRHLNPDATSRALQRQLLSDQARNNFVEGRRLTEFQGVTALKWVWTLSESHSVQRLVAVAPGTMDDPSETQQDWISPKDNGRILLLDFTYAARNGEKRSLTIEVGENEPEVLEEEKRELEVEVALARRRSIAQSTVSRISTNGLSDPFVEMGNTGHRRSYSANLFAPEERVQERESFEDPSEALETPYTQGDPRSESSLRRAATIAATNRRFVPRGTTQEEVGFRRPGVGQEEMPHESDADRWVPPPPPYQSEEKKAFPERLRNAVSPIADRAREVISPVQDLPEERSVASDPQTTLTSSEQVVYQTSSENVSVESLRQAYQLSQNFMTYQPEEDIYNVSPPGSPVLPSRDVVSPLEEPERTTYLNQQSQPLPEIRTPTSMKAPPAPLDLSAAQNYDSTRLTRPSNENLLSPNSPVSAPRTPDTATDSMFSENSAPQTPKGYVASSEHKGEAAVVDGLVMPSAEQLERLNSRTGRPPQRVLSDPSRKKRASSAGSSVKGRTSPPQTQRTIATTTTTTTTPADLGTPPVILASESRTSSPVRASPRAMLNSHNTSPSQSPSRRMSSPLMQQNNRYSSSTPNLRPRLNRLETIHSQTSTDEPTLDQLKSAGLLKPDGTFDGGKRRGWRGSFKRKQRPNMQKRQSADWNELLKHTQMQKEEEKKRKKKEKKCIVM